jgi:hypothetical protein
MLECVIDEGMLLMSLIGDCGLVVGVYVRLWLYEIPSWPSAELSLNVSESLRAAIPSLSASQK